MSPETTAAARSQRLIYLYALKVRVAQEIGDLEIAIEAEARAIALARREARASGGTVRRNQAVCGTDSGYYRHKRKHKEDACEPCKLAHRMAERRRQREKDMPKLELVQRDETGEEGAA